MQSPTSWTAKFANTRLVPSSPREKGASLPDLSEDAIVSQFGQVARPKRFPMKPMTIEEAIIEMELLDHDFFLFQNIETEGYNVIYRRKDSDYALIEPEAA